MKKIFWIAAAVAGLIAAASCQKETPAVSLPEGEEAVAFRGTLKQEEKTASLTIQSVESYGQTAELGLDIVLNASDKMPEMPQYTDLMKMTEEEVNGIVNDLYALIFQLALGQ